MSESAVGIELARHQWEEGRRALQRAAADPAVSRMLARQVEIVSDEIARRVGQVFTLAELVVVYGDADRWSLALLDDALPEGVPAAASTAADAAFEVYARRASDFTP